ncbi:MAG: efflux RND transporter periplasmic adaptor subunit [Treponema sp.]|jgi:multidrug efflux pump subunit AcrA (membrane-fusion protein)|nr:efflux RND transporter periplasmic adaptor subunit [Treponema sp.]
MKKVIVVIVVGMLAVGFMVIPSKLAGTSTEPGRDRPGRQAGSTDRIFAVRTEYAEIRNLQAYIEVNGNIVSAQQVAVVPDAAGKLVSMKVLLGSTVQKGALLGEVDPSRPGDSYSLSPIYAPVSGTVVSNPLSAGSTVSTSTTVLTLAATGLLEIEALIPEREVGQLRTGLLAEVRLEAFPGEIFTAELVRLSPVLDPVSRTKPITLRFIREDPRINPGMFARIKLKTRTYSQVIAIPEEGITENRGSALVYVVSPDNAPASALPDDKGAATVHIREISAGVSVDGEVEIQKGLNAGEAVVVQGQQFLTDGARVRVIGRK